METDFTYVQIDKKAWKELKIEAIKRDMKFRDALTEAVKKWHDSL
jgi:hypothetical protein